MPSWAQDSFQASEQDSLKGSITKERAWWNVLYYDLSIELDYLQKTIVGKNSIEYEIVEQPPTSLMQIDLQRPLKIDSVKMNDSKLSFTQNGDVWLVSVTELSDRVNKVTVHYSGKPKESVNPPYDGGIIWTKDSLDRPWISVACQLVGGSVWYPCKDHYSEEPDKGASLTLIIPDSLVAVGNGRLMAHKKKSPGKAAYTWTVVNPINNYGLSFYIGNYVNIEKTFEGEKGELDMSYWVLDYNQSKALSHMIPEVNKTMKTFEKWFGPYPFYEDGFKMVDASYIGMEHQSAIAYGNKYKKGRFNFKELTALDMQTDRLIVHEIAHEWFGNNITMSDIADRWVQDGFAAYGEELFIEDMFGREAGREFFLGRKRDLIRNRTPLISPYGIFRDAGPDMYYKGWAIIHMLREMINDDQRFRNFLREINRSFYHQTVSSGQIEAFISDFFDQDYSMFFDQYLRFSSIPVFEYQLKNRILKYRLDAEVKDLKIPAKVHLPDDHWLQVTTGWQETKLPEARITDTLTIDPNFLLQVKKMQ
jgi:aminopeptidase N